MLLSALEQVKSNYTEQGAEIVLRCPGCFGSIGYLQQAEATVIDCSACGLRLSCERGICESAVAGPYTSLRTVYQRLSIDSGIGGTRECRERLLSRTSVSGSIRPPQFAVGHSRADLSLH